MPKLQTRKTKFTAKPLSQLFNAYKTSKQYLFECTPFDANPFKPTLICLTGPSGSGKDTLMLPLVDLGILQHVQTATTRKRRYKFASGVDIKIYESNLEYAASVEAFNKLLDEYSAQNLFEETEPYNAYTWMRYQKPDESLEQYKDSLIAEYNLVECNSHYNNIYGLPLASLERASIHGGLPLVRNDINGVKHLRETLHEKFNILAIGIIPDSWEQVIESICNREEHISQEDLDCRLSQDANSIALYPELVNFVIQNHRGKVGEKDGLEYSVGLLKRLVTRLG